MGTVLLKVDEWKSPSGHYYVADVHTWTGWRECADVLGADTLEDYIHLLEIHLYLWTSIINIIIH